MNKTIFAAMLAAFAMVGTAGESRALTFALDDYEISLNEDNPGLVVYWNPILSEPASFDLDPGESVEFALFEIGTRETYVNLDDMVSRDITANFWFSSPESQNQADGYTRGRWVAQDGVVRWTSVAEFSFGQEGLFTITLMDTEFDLMGSSEVWARLDYLREDSTGPAGAPVPEPASVLLLGSGMVGMAWGFRRKKRERKP